MSVGRCIMEARIRAKLTQEELARKINITQPHVANIECGVSKPSFDTGIRLMKLFGFRLFAPKSQKRGV